MKKQNLSKTSGKKATDNDELKKPLKLKPDNKKAHKNWKNNLFDDEDDDYMFDDLKSNFDDDFDDFDDEFDEDDEEDYR
ncbi:MAG: hypothetical protein ACK4IK_08505 [Bacteroidia bacterium]